MTQPENTTEQPPSWTRGTVISSGRFRLKFHADGSGWYELQELVRQTGGGRGWWICIPTVPGSASDAE